MLDVALISRALSKEPGRSAPEAALESIVVLAQTGDHVRAAERAADLLADGYTDIRIIVAFALGAFEERGPAGLPEILGAIADAMTQRWAVIRPEARRERVVDSALSLLFRTLKALIDFHDNTRGPAWKVWTPQITAELPKACEYAISALQAAIEARVDQARSMGELAGVRTRAEQYFLLHPPEPPKAEAAEAVIAVDGTTDPKETAPEGAEAAEKPAPEPPPAPAARTIEVSPALEGFIRKLTAFSALMERGDLAKAAIVAQDIRATVDHFDPRVYLPKLLTPYFRLLSAHAAELAPHWEPSHRSEALAQLYQVDLDAFLEP